MNKLQFLVGTWSGVGRMSREPDDSVELLQTKQAPYKLDGLILTVEGVGKNKSDGKIVLQAFG